MRATAKIFDQSLRATAEYARSRFLLIDHRHKRIPHLWRALFDKPSHEYCCFNVCERVMSILMREAICWASRSSLKDWLPFSFSGTAMAFGASAAVA